MSAFDDAMIEAEQSAFNDLQETILLNGVSINAVIHALDQFTNNIGDDGGLSRASSITIEVFTSDLSVCTASNPIGVQVRTKPGTVFEKKYTVRGVSNNSNTSSLTCTSTAGTGRASF